MNQKYITEIKEEADRLMELTDNPYCQGPVSLLNGVKHVIPILLAEVERLTEENEKMKPFYKIADDTFKHWENAAYAMRDEERAKNAVKDQQIATLKKALEYACADRATTPSMWQDLQKKYMEIAHQAQESISRRYIARTVVGGNMNAKSGSAIKMIFGVKTVP